LPIRISTLNARQTNALLRFCVDCGCDHFEATASGAERLFSEFIAELGPDVVLGYGSTGLDGISGKLDHRSADLLTACFKTGLLTQGGSQPEARLSIRSAEHAFQNIQLETPRSSEASVILRYANDLQAEALYGLGIRFQVSPERPDLRPNGTWLDYGPANVYLHAPAVVNLDPQHFDRKRWAGDFETYGYDWYRCLENEYIQRWWTPRHDEALHEAIRQEGWAWSPPIDVLTSLAEPGEIERWEEKDWRCHRWGWGNILRNYAIERAKELHLTEGAFAAPEWVKCPLCGHIFYQAKLWRNWLSREQAVVCPVCFEAATWKTPESLGAEAVLDYLRCLAEVIREVPQSDFGQDPADYVGLSPAQVVEVVRLRKHRPTLAAVKEFFGSWFAALVAAGVLASGAQQMARGVRCMAEDGHVCLSLGEKTICDILHRHGIKHEREAVYPGPVAFRADWAIGDTLIEYFGLAGDPDYDARIKAKKAVAKEHGLTLVTLYPKDVADRARLLKKLGIGQAAQPGSRALSKRPMEPIS
jgi:hypothetical protein